MLSNFAFYHLFFYQFVHNQFTNICRLNFDGDIESVIAEDSIALNEALIEESVCDGIYYCVQNEELFRLTAKEYRYIVEQYYLKVLIESNKM